MNIRKFAALLVVLFAGWSALAEGTRTWEQSKYDELEKGTAKGIAIRSDGTLELAPAFKPLITTPSTYIWSIAMGAGDDVYVGTGAPARVYRVTPDGKSTVIFEPQELQVQSLAVDRKGVIYAATSPDGKVYKLEPRAEKSGAKTKPAESAANGAAPQDGGWASSVFFDPKTKYIWQLALDHDGRLYIATGDHGEIFRVERNGEGALFFKSDEAHIRTLAFDPKGNLIAGSDGSGLVYRISPAGEAFVLYSAPKKEITALAVDDAGNIYAAGVGEKRVATSSGAPPASSGGMITFGAQPAAGAAAPTSITTTPQASPAFPLPGMGAVGSEVYQIAPDGSPRRIWNSRDEVVYALGFGPHGRLLAGTGNKGRVFAIEGEGAFTDLLKASATQVTGFAKAPNGGLYVCTSNLGKLFLLGGDLSVEGTYQSDVFDARIFSRWGRAEVRGTGNYELWARSGNVDNPDRNWSPWRQVDVANGAQLNIPAARFVQWKAVLKAGDPAPTIDSVLLNYLSKNVAPVIEDVSVQVGGKASGGSNRSSGETSGFGAQGAPRDTNASSGSRDTITVRWAAHDDNDDQLLYSLYYRGDTESRWKLLKDKVTDKSYVFDAGLLPDGGYVVRVVATDAPSHSPEEALSDTHESQRFEIDTTPPRIDALNGAVEGNAVHVTFRAEDRFSVIKRAEYSLDAGDWQFVEPVGRLSDARAENYDFAAPLPGASSDTEKPSKSAKPAKAARKQANAGEDDDPPTTPVSNEHLVVVRVWDRFDNVATSKVVVHTK